MELSLIGAKEDMSKKLTIKDFEDLQHSHSDLWQALEHIAGAALSEGRDYIRGYAQATINNCQFEPDWNEDD